MADKRTNSTVADRPDIYGPCDEAIRDLDRENLRDFGKLKLVKFDEVHIIQAVTKVYREAVRKARKRYREMALEAYLIALLMCGISGGRAARMAADAITDDFIDGILSDTDFVTMYRFNTETDRKAQRLIEALSAISEAEHPIREPSVTREMEIDRALKAWAKQLGQYAINITDHAVAQALDDAGVDRVKWVTQKDQRVCQYCHELDGRVFSLDEVPRKHWNCRCYLVPAQGTDGE